MPIHRELLVAVVLLLIVSIPIAASAKKRGVEHRFSTCDSYTPINYKKTRSPSFRTDEGNNGGCLELEVGFFSDSHNAPQTFPFYGFPEDGAFYFSVNASDGSFAASDALFVVKLPDGQEDPIYEWAQGQRLRLQGQLYSGAMDARYGNTDFIMLYFVADRVSPLAEDGGPANGLGEVVVRDVAQSRPPVAKKDDPGPDGAGQLLSRLHECRAVVEAIERLACYDAVVAGK